MIVQQGWGYLAPQTPVAVEKSTLHVQKEQLEKTLATIFSL